jgi:IS30 family transposase
MMKAEKKQKEITAVLGVSQGTISKELKRNRGLRGYRPGQAEKKAFERQANKAARRRALSGGVLAYSDRICMTLGAVLAG